MPSNTNIEAIKDRGFKKEFQFTVSRSGGPGGQSVNKLNTKVLLRFDIENSTLLSDEEKKRLLSAKSNLITANNELLISVETTRSQLRNKEIAIYYFYKFVIKALYIPKKRIPTKPSRVSKEKRLEQKKKLSEIKKQRRMPKI